MSDTLLTRTSEQDIPGNEVTEKSSIEQLLADDFEPFYQELVERGVVMDSPEEKTAALEREMQFFFAVYDGVMASAMTGNGHVTALFDVDNTIIEVDDIGPLSGRPEVLYAARPAFKLVVRALRQDLGDNFEIGLLTTHNQEALSDELDNPTYLKAVRDMVNPDMVISSKDIATQDPLYIRLMEAHHSGETAILKDSVKDLADARLLDGGIYSDIPANRWFDIKLPIIDRLAKTLSGCSIVYIDDLPSAAVIDPGHSQVSGVWVGPMVHDYIRRGVVEQLIPEPDV